MNVRATPFRTVTSQCHLRGFGHCGHFPEEVPALGFFSSRTTRDELWYGLPRVFSGTIPLIRHVPREDHYKAKILRPKSYLRDFR
jgi:hypothetical protein